MENVRLASNRTVTVLDQRVARFFLGSRAALSQSGLHPCYGNHASRHFTWPISKISGHAKWQCARAPPFSPCAASLCPLAVGVSTCTTRSGHGWWSSKPSNACPASRHLVFSLPEAGQGAAASAQPEQPSAEVQQPQQQSPQSDERSQNSVGLGAGGSLLTPGTLSGDAEALHRARSHSRRGHVAVPLKLVYWRPPRTRTAPSVMQEFKMQLKAFGMRPVDVWAVDGKYYVCGQKCMRLEAISAHPNVKEVMCRVLEGPPPHMQPMLGTHYECFLDTVSRGLRKRATHKGAPKSKDASTAPPSVVVPDGKKGKAIPLGSFKDQLQSLKLSS